MSFNCNTCDISFSGRDAMIKHYDSALHNDNVKRRVNGMVPLTAASHGARSTRVATSVQTTSYKCTICDKRFATPQTLSSHLQSVKHKERKAKLKLAKEAKEREAASELDREETPDTEENEPLDSSDEDQPDSWEADATRILEPLLLEETDCLFCGLRAPSVEDNLIHMARAHNFTLPFAEEIIDVHGLVKYLALKVSGCLCLVCGLDRTFETREACQNHMASVGHQMLKLEDGEYMEFYSDKINAAFLQGEKPRGERAVSGKLALSSGATLVSKQLVKDHQAPPQLKTTSDDNVKLLTEAGAQKAHLTISQMNRYNQMLQARAERGLNSKKEKRAERQYTREAQKQRMRLGVHLNCLHGKGYQGDYVGKTI